MKMRCFPEHNYKSFFIDGKTMRIRIDPSKPITELKYPEFYDVKITNYCTGKCPYCYQNSLPAQVDKAHKEYMDAFDKIEMYFGSMTENQKPFQVAIGGGNPNEHPDFIPILSLFNCLGITPNYTTNGIGITTDILKATKKYCGGVAISCHPHLDKYWMNALWRLYDQVQTNLHIIISDKESIDRFKYIYDTHRNMVKYFVLLPYEMTGRAIGSPKLVDYKYLTETINKIGSTEDIAFGANFYGYLCNSDFGISLYEPEIFSKYLDLKDMKLYKSSFNLTEVTNNEK